MKFEADDPSEVSKAGADGVDRSQGAARAISVRLNSFRSFLYLTTLQSFIDPGLKWGDIDWFKSITKSELHCLYIPYLILSPMFSALDS